VSRRLAALLGLGVPLLALGCSGLFHASDPTIDGYLGDACSLLAAQKHAALDAEAKRRGISLTEIEDAFKSACSLRVKQGIEPGKRAGLAAARGQPTVGAEPCE
jgi:hypothetical protein